MTAPLKSSFYKTSITLHPFRKGAQPMREASRIYADVWSYDSCDAGYLLRQYPQMPCFYGCLAQLDGRTVGMGFGTDSVRGVWWHDRVSDEIGEGHPALQNAWVLTELAVLESFRNAGIGATILDYLTTHQPRKNMLLSTHADNAAAIRFYERQGWYVLHPGFPFHRRGKHFAIMARSLTR